MSHTVVGFVDAGFLRAEGARVLGHRPAAVRPAAAAIATWFNQLCGDGSGRTFLRAYWYDGAFDPSHVEYGGQRAFLEAIGLTPGIQLRLGHIAERPSRLERPVRQALERTAAGLGLEPERLMTEFNRHWTFRPERHQKGVDTLIALDMVRLASRAGYSTAVLIAGDRDLAEAVRASQDFGARVLAATPNRASLARELAQLADEVIHMPETDMRRMLTPRPARPGD
ncbi:MAG: NYN domain-containing protein [Acidobacteria bacterium]|nr:NYN domain-containing protein [Acidobacteriota bacterium]